MRTRVHTLTRIAGVVLLLSCSGKPPADSTTPATGTTPTGTTTTGTTTTGTPTGTVTGYTDFPADPQVEPGLPPDLPDLFTAASTAPGGPCLTEPASGALVPRNWTPLLFQWSAAPGQTVFELTLESSSQQHPLVVYTTASEYRVDPGVWDGLLQHGAPGEVQIHLRSAGFDGSALTTPVSGGPVGAVELSDVDAPGSVVFWSSAVSGLMGFTPGDTEARTLLTPATAGPASVGGDTLCLGCHGGSPDGELLFYTRDATDGSRAVDVRNLDGSTVDPAVVSPAALALLGRNQQSVPRTSPAHFGPTEALALTVMQDPTLTGDVHELVLTDLRTPDASGWGILARSGDPRQPTSPAWSRDGSTIAYVSSPVAGEGVIANTELGDDTMDIYTVPFNGGQGGSASPLPGASDPAQREFYPDWSPGDALLAFHRTDQAGSSYMNPNAEVFVVPGTGGAARRLAANDPPACAARPSPGQTNSWARWAPEAHQDGTERLYWLAFSSRRSAAATHLDQLYVAAVVTDDASGQEVVVRDYPALYVDAQDPTAGNHTPVWAPFDLGSLPTGP